MDINQPVYGACAVSRWAVSVVAGHRCASLWGLTQRIIALLLSRGCFCAYRPTAGRRVGQGFSP